MTLEVESGLLFARGAYGLKETLLNAHVPTSLQLEAGSSLPFPALNDSALNQRVSKARLFWILQGCGWITFGAAMFTWGLDFMSPRDALVNKILLVATGLTLTLAFRVPYRKLRKHSRNTIVTIVVLLAVSFIGAALWREAHTLLFQAYYSVRATGNISARFVWIPLGTFLYDGFVLLAWSLLYFAINDWMELERQRERAAKAEVMAQAARLRALQSQLEPHFLFNTLNAISTLVVEGQNADASRMIARLSDFLRLTLETADTPEIPVVEELEFVRRYLEIEQVRFGSRLHVTINAQAEAMNAMVPALVLQPLVENAVKHGVLTREQGGSVSVTAEQKNGDLRLCVSDDGPGLPQNRVAARGVGLRNIAARLSELYGNAARLSLDPSPTGGLAATIAIPFRSAVAGNGDSRGSS
jgi:two-component system, LytTR family, sensor kinase